MTKSEKKFDTGLRVMEVLKILLKEDIKKSELMEQIKDNENFTSVYTPEAFIKYFNTLSVLGFDIARENGKYFLKNALYEIELSPVEKELLIEVIMDYRTLHNKNNEKILSVMLKRINKYFNSAFSSTELNEIFSKEAETCYDEVKEKLILTISSLIQDKQLVKIRYKRGKNQIDELVVELKELIEKNQSVKLHCYIPNLARNKKINLNSVISLEQLPRKAVGVNRENSVIFELYGRLRKIYKEKDGEKLMNFNPDSITVSNHGEDKDILLRRLLKYGENCKIKLPKSLQSEFLELTDNILRNLEEN